MNPKEFRLIRHAIGLTQEGLAEALGMHRKSMIRFESGESTIPKRVELALHTLRNTRLKKWSKPAVASLKAAEPFNEMGIMSRNVSSGRRDAGDTVLVLKIEIPLWRSDRGEQELSRVVIEGAKTKS
jgi:transcriptional regulator with XRE-family HTH domain